jgi:hypothetical protein
MSSDRAEIENLLERYCWTVDHWQWNEWARCFTEDGVFQVRAQRLVGRGAILAYVQGTVGDYRLLRHLPHHPAVEIQGPAEAVARSYFELRGTTARGRDVEALGSYEDELVKTDDGWKFKLRKARFDYFVRRAEPWDQGSDP